MERDDPELDPCLPPIPNHLSDLLNTPFTTRPTLSDTGPRKQGGKGRCDPLPRPEILNPPTQSELHHVLLLSLIVGAPSPSLTSLHPSPSPTPPLPSRPTPAPVPVGPSPSRLLPTPQLPPTRALQVRRRRFLGPTGYFCKSYPGALAQALWHGSWSGCVRGVGRGQDPHPGPAIPGFVALCRDAKGGRGQARA